MGRIGLRVALCCGLALAAMAVPDTPARAAGLPDTVAVQLPSGEALRVALPPDLCGYPAPARDALKASLAAGAPPMHLLGAAGGCDSMQRFMANKGGVISPVVELAMFDSEIDIRTRKTPDRYHAFCRDQFPGDGTPLLSDTMKDDLRRLNGQTAGGAVSMGILFQNDELVIGGVLVTTGSGTSATISPQVVVCFAPAKVPILWTFAHTLPAGTTQAAITSALNADLTTAQDRATATLRMNDGR